ncbi:S-adenosyl-L-methionine-dependent methyltransferase [Cenococcum geophilum]
MAQNEQEIHIPVASEDDSNDSAYGDDVLSDTTSVASSIHRHRYEHGRRYHKYREGEYWGPNDDIQNDQLDIAHHMLQLLLDDNLYLAPITSPRRVLDIGTGTGICDLADEHPAAEVTGIDLSPIQPEFLPPNCKFEIDDCCLNWTFPLNHFDLIHIRCLYGSVADWPRLYKEVYNHLEPGGWLNQLEMDIQFKSDDGTCPPDNILSQWSSTFISAGEASGKTFKIAERAKPFITAAGFDNVVQTRYKVPLGGWSSDPKLRELGRWNLLHCYQGAEGWGLFLLTRVLEWSLAEANVFIAKFKDGLKDRKTHAYYEVTVVYGQKPGNPPD